MVNMINTINLGDTQLSMIDVGNSVQGPETMPNSAHADARTSPQYHLSRKQSNETLDMVRPAPNLTPLGLITDLQPIVTTVKGKGQQDFGTSNFDLRSLTATPDLESILNL